MKITFHIVLPVVRSVLEIRIDSVELNLGFLAHRVDSVTALVSLDDAPVQALHINVGLKFRIFISYRYFFYYPTHLRSFLAYLSEEADVSVEFAKPEDEPDSKM